MIQFDHLSKEYNGVLAVNDLTTEIPSGEIFGLLGPNGAGKSTTILMLIGLIEPAGGRCLIDGVEVAKNPITVKQHIGYMPEDVGFYPTLSAEENRTYFARLFRMEPREYKKRIPDLMSFVLVIRSILGIVIGINPEEGEGTIAGCRIRGIGPCHCQR